MESRLKTREAHLVGRCGQEVQDEEEPAASAEQHESHPAGAAPPAELPTESLEAEDKVAANGVLSRRAVAVAAAAAAAAAAAPDAEEGEETESEEEPSWELSDDLREFQGDPGDRKAQLLFKQLQTVRRQRTFEAQGLVFRLGVSGALTRGETCPILPACPPAHPAAWPPMPAPPPRETPLPEAPQCCMRWPTALRRASWCDSE